MAILALLQGREVEPPPPCVCVCVCSVCLRARARAGSSPAAGFRRPARWRNREPEGDGNRSAGTAACRRQQRLWRPIIIVVIVIIVSTLLAAELFRLSWPSDYDHYYNIIIMIMIVIIKIMIVIMIDCHNDFNHYYRRGRPARRSATRPRPCRSRPACAGSGWCLCRWRAGRCASRA